MTDPTVLTNANYSAISRLLSGPKSLWDNTGFDTTNIFAVDNTQSQTNAGVPVQWGAEERFRFRKRGGRVHNTWLKLTISAGTVNPFNEGCWVDDLAANMPEQIRVEYASKIVAQYRGDALKHYMRLYMNDIARETYFAIAQAGLPPGNAGAENSRRVGTPLTLYIPLDWLWFVRNEDYALTPEALAGELELVVKWRNLSELAYGRVLAGGAVANPWSVAPTITSCELHTQLIHTPKIEASKHLSTFESEDGHVMKVLDFEEQIKSELGTGAGTYKIQLLNFRADSQFLMFVIQDGRIDTPYALDRTMSDPSPTVLSGLGSVAGMLPIVDFQLRANGQLLVDTVTDQDNRGMFRKMYWPGSQARDFVYFIPFSWLLRDHRNVTGFQNMANLGNLEITLTLPAAPVGATKRYFTAFNVCHNIIQQKKGDIIRAVR